MQNGDMTSDADCSQQAFERALGTGVDPSGTPWHELAPERLRRQRSSVKWTRYPDDVLPLFVAEMDFRVAPEIRDELVRRVEASDTGYLAGPGPLESAFAGFARDRWAWQVPAGHLHLATDVATGIVESLRVARPAGGRLALSTPCYPGFFEILQEVDFEVVELPLRLDPVASLDLARIEREFSSDAGIDAFILCNPHNPHGLPFAADELRRLAELAAEHDVFVVSDEIHAPLVHREASFTPFAPIAAEAGALSVTTTSASKGWNLAGTKCSVIVAADERAAGLLEQLPPEVATRTSILGLHANVAAFSNARDWLDRAVAQIEANQALLVALLKERVPEVTYVPGTAGYLAWLDLRDPALALGEDPSTRLLRDAKVALNSGRDFGLGGEGFARLNLTCSPETIVRAVDRIAAAVDGGAVQEGIRS